MRPFWFSVFLLAALGFLAAAWLVPAHLRAVDSRIIESAGANATSVVEKGLELVRHERIGAAQMFLLAAEREGLPEANRLRFAITNFTQSHPELVSWGGADPYLEKIFPKHLTARTGLPQSAVEFLLPRKRREELLGALLNSRRPGVREIVETGGLTNMALFPPVRSASGQALDTAILIGSLLSQGDHLSTELQSSLESLAAAANRGSDTAALEAIYLDLLSLGKRLSWGQLSTVVGYVKDVPGLHDLAAVVRTSEDRLPVLYTSIVLAESAGRVVRYLRDFGETGWSDLSYGMRGGADGIWYLLQKQLQVYHQPYRNFVTSHPPFDSIFGFLLSVSRESNIAGLIIKYSIVFLGGFFLAVSMRFLGKPADALDEALEVRGIRTTRQAVFAFTFLLFAIIFAEPFLTKDSQLSKFPLVRLELPAAGVGIPTNIISQFKPTMDQLTLIALLSFLVLQSIIYAVCLIKIAEIRKQPVPSRVKLKLLDNEDNLFDAGLYCGMGGTVGSFVLLAMGIIKPSLMAAYSSTLFGIIFVAILKIFHLRPYKKRLILESELQSA